MLQLTKSNYHSLEANQQYMSNSQYRDFLECESMALAKIKGIWKDETSDALLVGSYVHAWNEGTLEEFKRNTPQLFKKDGTLYEKYKFADTMIDCLRQDAFCMFVLQGQKEVIFTAKIFGVHWKIMLDSYMPKNSRFAELKTTRSIRDLIWSQEQGQKVSFVEAYNYVRNAAVYCEVERLATGRDRWLEPIVVAVSKEDPPDKAIISLMDPELNMNDPRLYAELKEIEINMPRIMAVKNGDVEPNRCECCDYCRATKKLTKIIHYCELMAG